MRRRQFIAGLGGAAAAWPKGAWAQQATMPVIGYLSSLGRNDRPNLLDALRSGLVEAGYTEGRNIIIEYRFAENEQGRLPSLAAELVARKVAIIVATGGGNSGLAAKGATTEIPIVFTTGGDPVQQGFVTSLNRPGGNITGVSFFGSLVTAKAIGLLHEMVPNTAAVAILVNSRMPEAEHVPSYAQRAAGTIGRRLIVLYASIPSEIDEAFSSLRRAGAGALFVSGDPFFTGRRQQILALAARDAIPAMYVNREFVVDGGLMSYGNSVGDAYRRTGLVVGRVLKGEKPADLPVDQATKFEFVINRKTAKALGLEVPPKLLFTADEVIE